MAVKNRNAMHPFNNFRDFFFLLRMKDSNAEPILTPSVHSSLKNQIAFNQLLQSIGLQAVLSVL
jgi:hypothetical protein